MRKILSWLIWEIHKLGFERQEKYVNPIQKQSPGGVLYSAQKLKFSAKNFFSKFNQIRSFLQIWSHLQKKSLMEKKGVLRNLEKFTGKHLYQSLFFEKLQASVPWRKWFKVNGLGEIRSCLYREKLDLVREAIK